MATSTQFKVKLIDASEYNNSILANWMIIRGYIFSYNPNEKHPFTVEVHYTSREDFNGGLLFFHAQAIFV